MSDITIATAAPGTPIEPRAASSLRILISGGEGHIGRLLARYFSARGHRVTTLSRSTARSSAATAQRDLSSCPDPWSIWQWDGRNLGSWTGALEGADVLINLAGRSVDCRYNAKNRREILRSRVDSTAILGKALQDLRRPPRVWLNASTATIYRHVFDREMDEGSGEIGGSEPDAPASWRFSIEVAQQWERTFFASQTPGTRMVAMRTAMVMGPETGEVFEIVLRLVRMGLGGAWGSGRQYMSWIHEVDFCRAVEFLIEREEVSGAVNVAAPNPLPNEDFLAAVRDAWGIQLGFTSQEWILTVGAFLLRTETELLLKSRRVVPGILQKHRFEFLFPSWPEAARDLVQRWREQTDRGSGYEFS